MDYASVTALDWADSEGATGYDVYFGQCPVPAYPDDSFISVSASELTSLSLDQSSEYCWQVVATNGEGCTSAGPGWSFQTGCVDLVAGAPVVSSPLEVSYPRGTTGATYELIFSEDVSQVSSALSWAASTGQGTLDSITQAAENVWEVSFSGAVDGDLYTLTVGAGVIDGCGNTLAAPVDISIAISSATWDSCADPGSLAHGITMTPSLPLGETTNDGSGACWTESGADLIASYTATSTDDLVFQWSDVTMTDGNWHNYEVWSGSCDTSTGTELYCNNSYAPADGTVVTNVSAGDVFYMKVIAENSGADFSSANFTVRSCDPAWGSCAAPGGLAFGVIEAALVPTCDSTNDGAGSCGTPSGGDAIATYTATSTDDLVFGWSNFHMTSGINRSYEVWRASCDPSAGTEEYCSLTASTGDSAVVTNVAVGDVFYIKTIAADAGADIATGQVKVSSCNGVWDSCANAGALTAGAPTPLQLPTCDTTNDGSGSCWTESGADVIGMYTAASTADLVFTWSDFQTTHGNFRNYELYRGGCDGSSGVQEYCNNTISPAATTTVTNVSVGDVFYIKAIAENVDADFMKGSFGVYEQ